MEGCGVSRRGSRFLPEAEMLYAAVDYVCGVCSTADKKTVLLRDKVTTTAGRFEDEHRSFAGADAVEEQFLQGESGARFRYKLRCKRCDHQRVFRFDTLTDELRGVYAPGALEKVVQKLI